MKKGVFEIIKDLGPLAEEKCPNMHREPADEVQVASEAHKFHKSSRDQHQRLTSGSRRSSTGAGLRRL